MFEPSEPCSNNTGALKYFFVSQVVERICSFLPIPLLLNTRLVNSQFWHYSTCAKSFDPEIRFETRKQVKKFINLMENNLQGGMPFTRYYVDLSTVTDKSLLEEFGFKFGHTIKALRLNEFGFSFTPERQTERSKEMILELLSHSSQLQQLEISTKHEILLNAADQSKLRNKFPEIRTLSLQANVLEERPISEKLSLAVFIVSQSPGLKELFIPLTNFEYKQAHTGLVNPMIMKEVLAGKQSNPILRIPMTSLSCHTLDKFKELVDLRLKLRSLKIDFWGDSRGVVDFFRRWMTQQSSHLEKLKIDIWIPLQDRRGRVELPEMKNLKELEVSFMFRSFPHDDVGFRNPPLQMHGLPSLSTLIFNGHDGFGAFATLCIPTITHLEFYSVNKGHPFSAPWSKVLPNLSSLKCEFDARDEEADEKLSYILSHFPGIEDLELKIISKDASVDFWDIFTGDIPPVDDEYFKMPIVESIKNWRIDKEENGKEDEKDKIPSLENFKREGHTFIYLTNSSFS